MSASWFGPWFGNGRWFGPWFPDGQVDPSVFPGFGPAGAATFVLNLEAGFKLKHQWQTDIIKRFGGTEQRISINDLPRQFYSGMAVLTGDGPRTVRSTLARYASIGSAFLLGLPFEELTLVSDAAGVTHYVTSGAMTYCDWLKPSQRVVVVSADGDTVVNAVIQSTGAGTITLDVSTGLAGKVGGKIMPAMAVYLDPQQGFSRHSVDTEEWNIVARAALSDFAATKATLALGPITASAAFDNVTIASRVDGLAGNEIMFAIADNPFFAGSLSENPNEVTFNVELGVTTLGEMKAALDTSSLVQMTGTWNDSDVIDVGDDGDYHYLTGASALGTVGAGATLATFNGRPVWDRPIQIDGTAGDSIQAMTEVLDYGGVPASYGTADYADWGRHVAMERTGQPEWQWFKLFTATVRGRQKAFWLPTYRDDMTFISKNTNTITVSMTDGSDVTMWCPWQRDSVQIEQADGTITRATVTVTVDNNDGTATLTIGTTLSGSPVTRVSWLELCRFENDEFDITWRGGTFSVQTVARVVRL
jgi:hypothetical protein